MTYLCVCQCIVITCEKPANHLVVRRLLCRYGGNWTIKPIGALPDGHHHSDDRALTDADDGGGGRLMERVEHFPTAFTEHFPLVHHARYALRLPVMTHMDVVAHHANLPVYGLPWVSNYRSHMI